MVSSESLHPSPLETFYQFVEQFRSLSPEKILQDGDWEVVVVDTDHPLAQEAFALTLFGIDDVETERMGVTNNMIVRWKKREQSQK